MLTIFRKLHYSILLDFLFRDRLENGRSKDDEVSGWVWEAMEARTGKVRMEKAKRGRNKAGSRKKTRRFLPR